MIELQAKQVAQAVGGRLIACEADARRVVRGITWDSRQVAEGNIFLALPGQRVDGNDFVTAAVQAGAGAVICTREPSSSLMAIAGEFACPIIVVRDAQAALTSLARAWRRRLHAVVVGVTGSSGKTSTKDFLAALLAQRFKTCATQGNHNNELGVPATVLAADADTEVLVVEMGMRGQGQIAELCEFVHPSIGVVTNVGMSHLELLGSQEAIARAKGELYAALPRTGLAVLPADDPYAPFLAECGKLAERGVQTLSCGFSPEADVRAGEPTFDEAACASFELAVRGRGSATVQLAMPGRHSVANALAAAAVGSYLGMTPTEIATGLSQARPSGMRMEVRRSREGVTIVNDAYNANPDSVRASLATLAGMACTGRRIAVLGDMGELGPTERELHGQVGQQAARSGLDLLVCVGTLSECTRAGALEAGMAEQAVRWFPSLEGVQEFLASTLATGDLVLVKASRFMGMERLVEGMV